MNGVIQNHQLITFNFSKSLYIFALLVGFILSGCSQNETSTDSSQQPANLSFKTPDSILASRLDLNAGTLTATISYGTTTVPLTISGDGLTASSTIDNVPIGSTDFTIVFTYDLAPFGPLDVASATINITVAAGNNTLAVTAADYDTASFDADGDGVSNIVELDEASTSSPIVALCVLDNSQLGDCELGS